MLESELLELKDRLYRLREEQLYNHEIYLNDIDIDAEIEYLKQEIAKAESKREV